MGYLGGKARLAHHFAPILQAALDAPSASGRFLEPFVGGFNVVPHLRFLDGQCGDRHPGLISLYGALQRGWQPPEMLTEERWNELRDLGDWSNPEAAFAAFGMSFSGLEWGSYIRRDSALYCRRSREAMLEKARSMRGLTFHHRTYDETPVERGDVVYCDPPYLGTLGYGGRKGSAHAAEFDHEPFYDTCERWVAAGASVFVSEFTIPERPGWRTVWEMTRKISVDNKVAPRLRTDRLAEVRPLAEVLA